MPLCILLYSFQLLAHIGLSSILLSFFGGGWLDTLGLDLGCGAPFGCAGCELCLSSNFLFGAWDCAITSGGSL
jgi:hypothetical protein